MKTEIKADKFVSKHGIYEPIDGYFLVEDTEKEWDEKWHESYVWTRILRKGNILYKFDLMNSLGKDESLDMYLTELEDKKTPN